MNNSHATAAARLAVFALALGAFAAQAQQPDLQVPADAAASPVVAQQSLQGVVVSGGNALQRSDQRVALLGASLPLDAGNGVAQTTGLQRVAALFPRSPDAATGEARRMMDRSYAPPAGTDADGDLPLNLR